MFHTAWLFFLSGEAGLEINNMFINGWYLFGTELRVVLLY